MGYNEGTIYATYEDVRDSDPMRRYDAGLYDASGNRTGPVVDMPDEPLVTLEDFSAEEIAEIYNEMTEVEKREFDLLLRNSPPRALMPHQEVPLVEMWWEVMLLVGGRGTGKTVCGATAVRNELRAAGKMARIGIGAPTFADARDTCFEGETGLITMFPNEFEYYNRSQLEARHISGGFVKAMGTEKPSRWNGPQWSMLWFDELALCNQDSWDAANMGLRLGTRPYAVCTTTPKNKKWVKKLALDKTTYVPQYIDEGTGRRRLPTTFDNLFLPQRRVDWLKNKYGGSRMGRQELEGTFIDDIEGALWNRGMILHETDSSNWPRFVRIVIAVDPAGSVSRRKADQNALTDEQRQNQQKNADTAIAAVALGSDGKFYLLDVRSGQWTPNEWGMEVIRMYHAFRADKIVAEKNFGGLMVESNIRNVNIYDKKTSRQLVGRYLPIKLVTASRGKDIRAEPVSTLYEQGKVIHCGESHNFALAEDQMCAFIDADDNEGADMVDAIVWGVTELAGLGLPESSSLVLPGDKRFRTTVIMDTRFHEGRYF
jgi:predicted phage terminase large subunit-like protein